MYQKGSQCSDITIPNSETCQAIAQARAGVGLSRGFSSVAELMEDLEADAPVPDDL